MVYCIELAINVLVVLYLAVYNCMVLAHHDRMLKFCNEDLLVQI